MMRILGCAVGAFLCLSLAGVAADPSDAGAGTLAINIDTGKMADISGTITLDTPYYFKNRASGKYLTISHKGGRAKENGQNAQQWHDLAAAGHGIPAAQQWKLEHHKQYVRVKSVYSGKYLTDTTASKEKGRENNGAQIQLWAAGKAHPDRQLWMIVKMPNGYFRLLNKYSKKYMSVSQAGGRYKENDQKVTSWYNLVGKGHGIPAVQEWVFTTPAGPSFSDGAAAGVLLLPNF